MNPLSLQSRVRSIRVELLVPFAGKLLRTSFTGLPRTAELLVASVHKSSTEHYLKSCLYLKPMILEIKVLSRMGQVCLPGQSDRYCHRLLAVLLETDANKTLKNLNSVELYNRTFPGSICAKRQCNSYASLSPFFFVFVDV